MGSVSRREVLAAGIGGALGLATSGAMAEGAPPDDDELIRVAPDHWTFQGARTRRRFVPFGSNLVLTSKDDLDIFGKRYEAARYERILAACEGLGIDLLKVFLPYYSVLPDPQAPGDVRCSHSHLDNLEGFLQLCRGHHIRAVVSLAEWGGSGLHWWREGGEYFGRRPWRTDPGVDSLEVLCGFWRAAASRFRGHPTIFAWEPCVEWSLPEPNLTAPWSPPPQDIGILRNEIGTWYWRHWALAKYGTLDRLNKAWGTAFRTLDDVTVVDYSYDGAAHRYADPERKVLDYQNFREWGTLSFFRPQVAAIRAADPGHMVTIANHMRHWGLWEGAARYFMADTAAEEKPLVDYVTHHANYDEDALKDGRPLADVVREVELECRFSYAGKPMPVVIEEFTFGAADPKRTAEAQAAIVRGTIGHASGWTTWYLQYPAGANVADSAHASAWLDGELTPTAWGEQARVLSRELGAADLRRKPAKRTVKLDRAAELVPKSTGTMIRIRAQYDKLPQPTDFVVSHERDLDIRL